MYQYNQDSLLVANIVFSQKPHVKVLALREDPRRYTIVRRADTPSNQLFSDSFNFPSRINIHELRNRFSTRMNFHGYDDNLTNYDILRDFINHTLTSHQPRVNPLSQEVIETLQETKLKENEACLGEKCCICLDSFSAGEKVIILKCNHITHSPCLRRWFTEHNTCPQCRFIPGSNGKDISDDMSKN